MLGEESWEYAVSVLGLVQMWVECMGGERGARYVMEKVKTKNKRIGVTWWEGRAVNVQLV